MSAKDEVLAAMEAARQKWDQRGDTIETLARLLKISTTDLADQMGMKRPTMTGRLKGYSRIEPWELPGFALVFGVPIDVLDHDHKTGLTRGLLCPSCNTALGMSGAISAKRKRYLAKPPAAKFGWYYITSFGDVPERTGDYVVDRDKARKAIHSLSFAPQPDDDWGP